MAVWSLGDMESVDSRIVKEVRLPSEPSLKVSDDDMAVWSLGDMESVDSRIVEEVRLPSEPSLKVDVP
ncbi:hypothetical protein L6452_15181 [Arctium lappa]|uniref:Uncharacterized protein n=1 Tax=Arctium lappa TaxID=4217 RepID=A0ACB9CN50_ARCLA|nr:hypothetical protein L6452_15181 [Arctium lappa]